MTTGIPKNRLLWFFVLAALTLGIWLFADFRIDVIAKFKAIVALDSDIRLPILEEMRANGRNPLLVSKIFRLRTELNGSTNHQTGLRVPNIVHYVLFRNGSEHVEFMFITYLSFLSVHKFIVPDAIFVHGNVRPEGRWWKKTLADVDNVFFVNMTMPMKAPSGETFSCMAHLSDVVRLQVEIEYGGIYLDPDVLVLKSFDPLRRFRLVLGREMSSQLNNGIIIAEKGTPFLYMWLDRYRDYRGSTRVHWGMLSLRTPHELAGKFPRLIHVEDTTICTPGPLQLHQLFVDGSYNWTNNYSVHVWKRIKPQGVILPAGPEQLYVGNATVHQLMRYVYFSRR